MMEVRCAQKKDPFSRYYTEATIGHLFVSLFDQRHANAILDLGSGGGALSLAAASRWGTAKILTVDLDSQSSDPIRYRMATAGHRRHEHLIADAFDENLPSLLQGITFDLAVCNPPYNRPVWRQGFSRILEEADLADLHTVPKAALTSELVFVAQILRLAQWGAEVGIIVPDGLISGSRSREVRRVLLRRTDILRIVQLPRGSFRGTDAQAHIIVLRNEPGRGSEIEISRLNENGLSAPLRISAADAEHRMDYAYHETRSGQSAKPFTLRSISAEIFRGSLSSVDRRSSDASIFHTTDFLQSDRSKYELSLKCDELDGFGRRVAEPGDILIARVDRDLQRKICLVESGRAVLTDCIYRVRVAPTWRQAVLRALLSSRGQNALLGASRGVGARMLAKADLLDIELERK